MTPTTQILLQTALNVLLLVVAAYKAFGSAYFTEKGKSLATKEDIAEITRQVESVKTEFTKDTEQLKADLQHYSQARIALNVDAKNAVVECYERFEAWKVLVLHPPIGKFSQQNYQEVYDDYKAALEKADNNLRYAEAKMAMYVAHDGFEESGLMLTIFSHCRIQIMRLDGVVSMLFSKAYNACITHAKADTPTPQAEYDNAMQLYEKLQAISSELSEERRIFYQNSSEHLRDYAKKTYDYISRAAKRS